MRTRTRPPGKRRTNEIAADRLAGFLGRELSDERRGAIGSALHLGLALSGGAAYALARRRYPRLSAAGGLLYGALFFLAVDEGLNTVLKLTPPPPAFPWQAHFRGAVAHLAFGAASETSLRLLEAGQARWAGRRAAIA